MSLIVQFFQELERRTLPVSSARDIYSKLEGELSQEQKAQALQLITELELLVEQRRSPQGGLIEVVPRGWLQDYLALCQVSEAPDSFHLFSAIATMTHLIGKRMWFGLGMVEIYPPTSSFLVSPAAAGRRSTAIKIATRIGVEANAHVLQDMMTPEGLIKALEEMPIALVVADEAASLLSKSEYMNMMPQLLCTLLDCPAVFERILKGKYVRLENVTVNALLGCAPDWILTSIPKSALGGGLFSRMLVVYEAGRKRLIPLPDEEVEPELVRAMRGTLVSDLRTIVEQSEGRVVYSSQAKGVFKQFYHENDARIKHVDEKLGIYMMRKPEHVHRMVMTLLASTGKGNEASVEILETALAILKFIEEGMVMAYQTAGLERPGQHQMRVLKIIDRLGGKVDHSVLLTRVSDAMSSQDLIRVMDSLEQQRMVRVASRLGKGRIVRFYERIRDED